MDMETLLAFIDEEHERLVARYDLRGKAKYPMLAKLMEELGELSDALLAMDNLQRKGKDAKDEARHEICDVIFCALILAKELDVDILPALKEKIEKVKEREY